MTFCESYVCTTLKYNWLVSWAFAIRKCAHGLCSFVFKTCEKLMKLVDTESFQEPFAGNTSLLAKNEQITHL